MSVQMGTPVPVVTAAPPVPRAWGGRHASWIGLVSIFAIGLSAAVIYWQHMPAGVASPPPPKKFAAIREATVQAGTVETTLRLSGTTAAREFASLVAPELSGSRSGFGRSGGGSSSTSAAVAPLSAQNKSNSTSTNSSAPDASTAFQSATSRFGGTLRGSAPKAAASAASSAAASSTALGGTGMGSTAGSLPGGSNGPPSVGSSSGGGGGGGDFGLILEDVAPPGTRANKGDVVAAFDRQYMLLRLDDYRASVAQNEAALTKQKADLEITRTAHQQLIASSKADLEKARLDTKTIPVLSAIDAERSKLAFEEAQARYDQLLHEVKFVRISEDANLRNAELDLAQAKIELQRAERNTDRMVVKAPIAGLVVMQNTFRGSEFAPIQKGDEVWPGESFMQIVNPSSMVINASVNQSDVQLLKVGATARVRFDAYGDLELPARVEAIGALSSSNGQRASFVRAVPVRLRLEKMDPRVIPDLSVSVDVALASPQRAAAVAPVGAIFHDEGSRSFVYVRESTGWESRPVETGARNNLFAVVKRGLSPGEVIALDEPTQQTQ